MGDSLDPRLRLSLLEWAEGAEFGQVADWAENTDYPLEWADDVVCRWLFAAAGGRLAAPHTEDPARLVSCICGVGGLLRVWNRATDICPEALAALESRLGPMLMANCLSEHYREHEWIPCASKIQFVFGRFGGSSRTVVGNLVCKMLASPPSLREAWDNFAQLVAPGLDDVLSMAGLEERAGQLLRRAPAAILEALDASGWDRAGPEIERRLAAEWARRRCRPQVCLARLGVDGLVALAAEPGWVCTPKKARFLTEQAELTYGTDSDVMFGMLPVLHKLASAAPECAEGVGRHIDSCVGTAGDLALLSSQLAGFSAALLRLLAKSGCRLAGAELGKRERRRRDKRRAARAAVRAEREWAELHGLLVEAAWAGRPA